MVLSSQIGVLSINSPRKRIASRWGMPPFRKRSLYVEQHFLSHGIFRAPLFSHEDEERAVIEAVRDLAVEGPSPGSEVVAEDSRDEHGPCRGEAWRDRTGDRRNHFLGRLEMLREE